MFEKIIKSSTNDLYYQESDNFSTLGIVSSFINCHSHFSTICKEPFIFLYLNMKKLIFLIPIAIFLFACESGNDKCACYDAALDGEESIEECAEYVKGLSEEELEEKSNECFGETVDDMSGAGGL